MGRPPSIHGDFDVLADHLRFGRTYEQITELMGLSKRQVQSRVDALRKALAEREGDVYWLKARPVEAGRAWRNEEVERIEEVGRIELPDIPESES